jgi:hypothetical protein
VKNCYPSFTAQFDQLVEEQVIWEPYTEETINARYPGGISAMCTRDRAYWMTKSKIIFDVSVEEMAQHRVMRQFGWRQMAEPPAMDAPLEPHIHRYVQPSFLVNMYIKSSILYIDPTPTLIID